MELAELKAFLAAMDSEARDAFAKRCGSTKGHLQNVMYGVRPCATDLAVAIERESRRVVRRWALRPSDWHRHWPELIAVKGAPPIPELEKRAA